MLRIAREKTASEGGNFRNCADLVRERGLEPPRPKALAPKASVSTNSTTRAQSLYYSRQGAINKEGNRKMLVVS